MARAATWAALAFGLAIAASLAIDRVWPKARAEPFALMGAGLVMLAAGSPPREGRARVPAAAHPAGAAIALPPQQRAS
ncbi:MAG: hypothetical protein ACYDCL_08020 [Myxococcales bacterium]